jgi:hypothetical protein
VRHQIPEYPTVLYGDPKAKNLTKYERTKDHPTMQKFVIEDLGAESCGPSNLDLCDATEKKWIEKYMKWDMDELDAKIDEYDAKFLHSVEGAESSIADLENQIKKLQDKQLKHQSDATEESQKYEQEAGRKYLVKIRKIKDPKKEEKNDDPDFDPDFADEPAPDADL